MLTNLISSFCTSHPSFIILKCWHLSCIFAFSRCPPTPLKWNTLALQALPHIIASVHLIALHCLILRILFRYMSSRLFIIYMSRRYIFLYFKLLYSSSFRCLSTLWFQWNTLAWFLALQDLPNLIVSVHLNALHCLILLILFRHMSSRLFIYMSRYCIFCISSFCILHPSDFFPLCGYSEIL